jgi:hypothetical protein
MASWVVAAENTSRRSFDVLHHQSGDNPVHHLLTAAELTHWQSKIYKNHCFRAD